MKSLVIYDTFFGNTKKIAEAIGKALGSSKDVATLHVNDVKLEQLKGVNLVVVGSPTRAFKPTDGIKNFLKNLPTNALRNIKVAVFDTRISADSIKSPIFRFIVDKAGYAAKTIAKLLTAKGGNQVVPSEGFIVKGSEGPLKEGELERAAAWAKTISKG